MAKDKKKRRDTVKKPILPETDQGEKPADKGKQPGDRVEQDNENGDPSEGRVESSSSHATTAPTQYRVPRVERPRLHYRLLRVRCKWPRRVDGYILSIPELEDRIHKLQVYSEKHMGSPEWDSLESKHWLPMLWSICNDARECAKFETKAMERDLTWYREMFPPKEAAALRWPEESFGHWYRPDLNGLLVE